MTKNLGLALSTIILASTAVFFQNCSSPTMLSSNATAIQRSGSGNGDGYGGKPRVFIHFDASNPCTEVAPNGKALANDAVLVSSASSAQVVRENCRDVRPRDLSASEFTIESSDQLRLGAKVFTSFPTADFQYVASACPVGRSPLASPVRDNYFDSPFDLSVDPWGTIGGFSVAINGAIGGVPSSRLTRSVDATTDPGIRVDQYLGLKPDTDYVLSFVAGESSSSMVRVEMYGAGGTGGLFEWNLSSGNLITNEAFGGISNVTSVRRSFGGGWLFTVYFRTLANTRNLDIGFAPSNFGVGEYVDVSAAQLEEVDAFCAR